MKNIYRVPTTKNFFLFNNCFLFYKTLYQTNQKWSLLRYIIVVLLLNIKILLKIKLRFNFSDYENIFSENSQIYLIKNEFNKKLVFFTFENGINYIYKLFPKKDKGFEREIFIFNNITVQPSSKLRITKIESAVKETNFEILKIKVNSFKLLNPNKDQKNFIDEYLKFHDKYLKELNIIHNDFTYWNVSKSKNYYEIFDWEGYTEGPVENDLIWFYLTSNVNLSKFEIDLSKLDLQVLKLKIENLGKSRHDKKIIKKYRRFINTHDVS